MKRVVIPVSGGLDSVTLLHYVAKNHPDMEIWPVFIQYGQKHMIELDMSSIQVSRLQAEGKNVRELKVVNMDFLGNLIGSATSLINKELDIPTIEATNNSSARSTAYVPYRNLVFISVLMSYAETVGAEEVYFGSISEQEYTPSWDTTQEFTDAVNAVSNLNSGTPIHLRSPFAGITKGEEIQVGKYLDVDYSKTWSSYGVAYNNNREPLAHNNNVASAERIRAFARNGIEDPIQYQEPIDWVELYEKYYPLGHSPVPVESVMEKIEQNFRSF